MQGNFDVQRSAKNGAIRTYDLDALAALESHELARLYAMGSVGELAALDGHPTGRMLAVRGLDRGPISRAIRAFAGARPFPWGGKSFASAGERGTGVNRVHLGGRQNLFPFLTAIAPSVVDNKPSIVLDYDLPDNPWFIRAIHDEVREVDSGLFLGPAMLKTSTGPKHVLWFALDTRAQATPIGTKQGAA